MPGGNEPKAKKRRRTDRREKEKPLLAVQVRVTTKKKILRRCKEPIVNPIPKNHASNKGKTAGRYHFDTQPTRIG